MMIKQKIVTAVLVAVGMFTASGCTNTARQEQATTEPNQPTAQPSQPATGTRSIYNWVKSERAKLIRKGVCYPSSPGQYGRSTAWAAGIAEGASR
jgi:hypothetical protein